MKYATKGNNVEISGNCVKFENNKLFGEKSSRCTVSIYRDGKKITFNINILASNTLNFKRFLKEKIKLK